MKNNMKKAKIILPLLGLGMLGASTAQAICPICTLVVSSGVGLSRYLGVDDSVSGLWVGGLTVSAIVWTLEWMEKKKINFRGRAAVTVAGYYAFVLSSFYFTNLISNPIKTICACATDKLFLGIVVGSAGFWMGAGWYYFLKERNGGRAYFPFQKVVFPVTPLILTSVFFYYLTK